MKQKKMENKGFTLIELIIVMAIMAILLGIVGTQVIPYLNKAREAKDLQIINSFSTAGVSAYSMNAERFAGSDKVDSPDITVYFSTGKVASPSSAKEYLLNDIIDLVGYTYDAADDKNTLNQAMKSTKGKTIKDVAVTISFKDGKVTAQGLSDAGESTKTVLDKVESEIGKPTT